MDNLIACLALYQHRQDKAVGINWLSERTRGLLWYYGYLQQKQVEKLWMAGYLNGIIQQGHSQIKMLVARADKTRNKHKILERVKLIEQKVKEASEKLNELKETDT